MGQSAHQEVACLLCSPRVLSPLLIDWFSPLSSTIQVLFLLIPGRTPPRGVCPRLLRNGVRDQSIESLSIRPTGSGASPGAAWRAPPTQALYLPVMMGEMPRSFSAIPKTSWFCFLTFRTVSASKSLHSVVFLAPLQPLDHLEPFVWGCHGRRSSYSSTGPLPAQGEDLGWGI